MALNMKTLTQALAKTAAVIEKTVQTTVQEVTGPKPLQDYELGEQIGSAGPGLAWKLYSAKARSGSGLSQQYTTVCVWVLDKRTLSEARVRAGLSKAAEDSFFDIVRADAARLVRLRHPGVVHVVQALDESKNAMAMVTEPLFASAANTLGNLDNISKAPKELKGMEMGLLEVKHGLLQIAESLNFLHNNAHLIHRAISPENVLVTSSGSWKLSGFGFAILADQSSGESSNMQAFHYAEYDVEDSLLPLQPSLNYTAPELIRSKTSSVGCASDIFSFGCLAYHFIARKPLFDCHNNIKMYMNNLTYLSSEAFSSIPPELVPDLQKMLSPNEAFRPTALDFTGSPFFRNDPRLRALRFLDHMLERDNMQKSEFLKALSDMWQNFDSRVLRYKVLPPLCAELRNLVLQPMILPMVLTIAEAQDKSDFELSTLPTLVPVLSTASGETLLLLVKHAGLIINKASQVHLVSYVLPLLLRAYDDNDAHTQEEGLKRTVSLAKQLDIQVVKEAILPRIHGLALKTTVAAVRVNALLCLGDMVHMLDKHSVLEILQTIKRCTAVDRSAPTLMCTLGVAISVLKQYGLEFTAENVLPLITPLLIVQQLNVQQFAKYMLFVKDILRRIEEKRGVTVTDSGFSEVRQSPAINGSQPQAVKNVIPTATSTSSNKAPWDEDWVPTIKGPAASIQSSTTKMTFTQPATANPPNLVGSSKMEFSTSAVSSQQMALSCPPVEIEWPPRTSSGVLPQSGEIQKQNQNSGSSASFDDIDPFADWTPRPIASFNASGYSNSGILASSTVKCGSNLDTSTQNCLNLQRASSNSWGFNIQNSNEPVRQNQGNSKLSTDSFISGAFNQNSLGILEVNQGISALGITYADRKTEDLRSIFASQNEQVAPRLAPPPLTAVGRGIGRGRGHRGQPGAAAAAAATRSRHNKSTAEQSPLMDLL